MCSLMPPPISMVYPRACGGTPLVRRVNPYQYGLSPRVRGNHYIPDTGINPNRSIPARAGEPASRTASSPVRRVYPRACGGTKRMIFRCHSERGLSPRVRGNRPGRGRAGRAEARRSIPARAGEPHQQPQSSILPQVYPRACGGTLTAATPDGTLLGLSPRVRGNRPATARASAVRRSIPARAGEPHVRAQAGRGERVYPRACGGTCGALGLADGQEGLSPRVRGNRSCNDYRCWCSRSIPARAGEPSSGQCSRVNPAVYPRACGEPS